MIDGNVWMGSLNLRGNTKIRVDYIIADSCSYNSLKSCTLVTFCKDFWRPCFISQPAFHRVVRETLTWHLNWTINGDISGHDEVSVLLTVWIMGNHSSSGSCGPDLGPRSCRFFNQHTWGLKWLYLRAFVRLYLLSTFAVKPAWTIMWKSSAERERAGWGPTETKGQSKITSGFTDNQACCKGF